MHSGPVLDLGKGCEYGLAYLVTGNPQKIPTVFQCNVGYMESLADYGETARSTRNMLRELIDDPHAGEKGFVCDLIAVFRLPSNSSATTEGGYTIREINLSAWADETAAHNWYKNSPGHKDIVKSYYGSGLTDFSSVLTRLQVPPELPTRWDVRCKICRRVVSGPKINKCPYCGAATPSMPYF